MGKKGFTLIELILVITILGILAVSALPKFLNLTTAARNAARDGVVGAVRSGIALYKANQMAYGNASATYPSTLDSNANGSACATCFSDILETGINDANWTRTNSAAYTYNNGAVVNTYTYNVTNGTFQ